MALEYPVRIYFMTVELVNIHRHWVWIFKDILLETLLEIIRNNSLSICFINYLFIVQIKIIKYDKILIISVITKYKWINYIKISFKNGINQKTVIHSHSGRHYSQVYRSHYPYNPILQVRKLLSFYKKETVVESK